MCVGYWREIKIEDAFPFPPSVQKLSQSATDTSTTMLPRRCNFADELRWSSRGSAVDLLHLTQKWTREESNIHPDPIAVLSCQRSLVFLNLITAVASTASSLRKSVRANPSFLTDEGNDSKRCPV